MYIFYDTTVLKPKKAYVYIKGEERGKIIN